MNKYDRAFDQGYFAAIAVLVSSHGESRQAVDVLAANLPKSLKHIEKYDLKILKGTIKEVRRLKKLSITRKAVEK